MCVYTHSCAYGIERYSCISGARARTKSTFWKLCVHSCRYLLVCTSHQKSSCSCCCWLLCVSCCCCCCCCWLRPNFDFWWSRRARCLAMYQVPLYSTQQYKITMKITMKISPENRKTYLFPKNWVHVQLYSTMIIPFYTWYSCTFRFRTKFSMHSCVCTHTSKFSTTTAVV